MNQWHGTDEQAIARVAELFKERPEMANVLTKMVTKRNLEVVRVSAKRDQAIASIRGMRPHLERFAGGDFSGLTTNAVGAMACFCLGELAISDMDARAMSGDGGEG